MDVYEGASYPKSTPPKATNRPIMIAGAAEPTASSGFLKAKPMIQSDDGIREEDSRTESRR